MINRRQYYSRVAISLLITLTLTGCITESPVRNHQKDYVHAYSTPPLKTPPGVTLSGVKDRYPLNKAAKPFSGQPSLIPPGNPGAAK